MIRFSNLQISPKKYSKKTILSLKFRFQVQDSFLECFFFFGDWEIWKTNHTYWKKPHLKLNRWNESFYYVLLFTCDEVASTKSVPCKEIEPEILIYNNVVLAFHDACLLVLLVTNYNYIVTQSKSLSTISVESSMLKNLQRLDFCPEVISSV